MHKKPYIPLVTLLFTISRMCGISSIEYCKEKESSPDGPFVSSNQLFYLNLCSWTLCLVASVFALNTALATGHILFPTIVIIAEANFQFFFWVIGARWKLLNALNQLYKLYSKSDQINATMFEKSYPFFPYSIFFVKLYFQYYMFIRQPWLQLLAFYCRIFLATHFGLVYAYLLLGEKLYLYINERLKINRISHIELESLMHFFVELQDFHHYLSNSFSLGVLISSVYMVCADVVYLNNFYLSFVKSLLYPSFDTINKIMDFFQWHIKLYNITAICYRSHRISREIEVLKSNLQKIQANSSPKNNFQAKQLAYRFERMINTKKLYFTAFGSVQFNCQVCLSVLSKAVTYMFSLNEDVRDE